MGLGMIEATALIGQMRKVRLKKEDWKAQLSCSGHHMSLGRKPSGSESPD